MGWAYWRIYPTLPSLRFTAPRAPTAALSAASGRSPRALGGMRSAMSPTGETPPGRRQGDKSKRLRSHTPAPLPARTQAAIFSVCFQQEPHVNKVLLLFVAHAYCALAKSRSMLPHTIVAAVCNASYSMQCCLFANIHTLLVLYLPMTGHAMRGYRVPLGALPYYSL
jgi:hypothetical protein